MRILCFALLVVVGCSSGDDDQLATRDGGPGAGTCERPFVMCGNECVSTVNNPSHCGGCSIGCEASSFCEQGFCTAICSVPGLTACGAACADLQTDRTHCGRCDRACPMDRDCRGGACVCPEGTTDCNGQCVDTDGDRNHCGLCGRVCTAEQFCAMGSCQCMGGNREASCLNGIDDDCDTLVDCLDPDCIGSTRSCMGACGEGAETCLDTGAWGMCQGGDGSPEICGDGIDQDCSGQDLRMPDSFEPNDDCSTCKLVSATADPNLTIMGSFDSVNDNVDCYKLIADDGNSYQEHIRLSLTNVPMGNDYDLFLYRGESACASGETLASSLGLDNADEQIDWGERFGSDDSGEYFIRVTRYDGYSCTEQYSLQINGLD